MRLTWKYTALAVAAALAGMMTAYVLSGRWAPEETVSAPLRQDAPIRTFVRHARPVSVEDISFTGPRGEAARLSEWRGKTVLLNLWATWCAPCRTEMPSLDRLQAKRGSRSFAVLAVSMDRGGLKEPAAFFAREGIAHLKLYNDKTGEAVIKMKAPGLPLTVVLNANGAEIARFAGPAEWDSPAIIALIDGLREGGRP